MYVLSQAFSGSLDGCSALDGSPDCPSDCMSVACADRCLTSLLSNAPILPAGFSHWFQNDRSRFKVLVTILFLLNLSVLRALSRPPTRLLASVHDRGRDRSMLTFFALYQLDAHIVRKRV